MTNPSAHLLKQTIARHVPSAVRMYRRHLRPHLLREFQGLSTTERFELIYHSNRWGDPDSRSGQGSNLSETAQVRARLPELLDELKVSTILDAPCGDFHWMQTVEFSAHYVGVDIVAELVEENTARYGSEHRRFICADIARDGLPSADLILCRDALVHLSFEDVGAALQRFADTGATHLVTTTFRRQRHNDRIETGYWRPLNLELPPFNFPAPLELVPEPPTRADAPDDKSLGVWRISDLGL